MSAIQELNEAESGRGEEGELSAKDPVGLTDTDEDEKS